LNLCRREPADLQSAPFNHSGIDPYNDKYNGKFKNYQVIIKIFNY
jgi:hypothetical protein